MNCQRSRGREDTWLGTAPVLELKRERKRDREGEREGGRGGRRGERESALGVFGVRGLGWQSVLPSNGLPEDASLRWGRAIPREGQQSLILLEE